MMRQKIVKWVLFPLFFIFVFFVALYWTFPVHTLKKTVKNQVEAFLNAKADPRSSVPARVEIDSVSLWRISGLSLAKIIVSEPGSQVQPGAVWEFDSLKIRRSITSLLFGDASYSFDAQLYDGSIDGSISLSAAQEMSSLDIEISNLDLQKAQGLRQRLGAMAFTGLVNLEMDLYLGKNPAQEGEMHLNADIRNLRLGILGSNDLGNMTVNMVLENGKAPPQPINVRGEDFEATALVSLELNNDIWRSTFEGAGTMLLKGQLANAATLLESTNPRARSAKEADGKYAFYMNGSLNRPRFDFGKNAPSRPNPRNSRLRSIVPSR